MALDLLLMFETIMEADIHSADAPIAGEARSRKERLNAYLLAPEDELTHIGTDPSHQKKGHASALIRHLARLAEGQSHRLEISVPNSDNVSCDLSLARAIITY